MKRPAAVKRILAAAFLGAALAFSLRAQAEPVRVALDIPGAEDDASRAVSVRLVSELTAAGFSVSGGDGAVRASLVRRDDRWALFVELPDGGSLVVRADDVPASELPAVLALRAVERLRAALSAPAAASPPPAASAAPTAATPPTALPASTASPPPPSPVAVSTPPRAASPPAAPSPGVPAPRSSRPRAPFEGFFLAAGGLVTVDGGAVAGAPIVSAGLGVGAGFFLRASVFGPGAEGAITAPEGLARVTTFGGRLEAGFARAVREGTSLGAIVGLGGDGYAVEGEARPGFVARSETAGAFVAGVRGLVVQHITGPLHLFLDAGVELGVPSVNVRIAGKVVSERGLPAVVATPGALLAF